MDDVGDLVRLWGAKKLTEDNQPRYREDIKIDPSTVEISDGVGKSIARYVNRNAMRERHWKR